MFTGLGAVSSGGVRLIVAEKPLQFRQGIEGAATRASRNNEPPPGPTVQRHRAYAKRRRCVGTGERQCYLTCCYDIC